MSSVVFELVNRESGTWTITKLSKDTGIPVVDLLALAKEEREPTEEESSLVEQAVINRGNADE